MFTVLQPHSNTNCSDKYLVVDDKSWIRYINRVSKSFVIAAEKDSYDEALTERDRLNAV